MIAEKDGKSLSLEDKHERVAVMQRLPVFFVVVAGVSLQFHNYFPLSVSTGALCEERHLLEGDEARLLPRSRSLSGLLQVAPFISFSGTNIQVVCKHLAEKMQRGCASIANVGFSAD